MWYVCVFDILVCVMQVSCVIYLCVFDILPCAMLVIRCVCVFSKLQRGWSACEQKLPRKVIPRLRLSSMGSSVLDCCWDITIMKNSSHVGRIVLKRTCEVWWQIQWKTSHCVKMQQNVCIAYDAYSPDILAVVVHILVPFTYWQSIYWYHLRTGSAYIGTIKISSVPQSEDLLCTF